MIMKSGVYIITNTKNGKVYIGSTNDFKTRWDIHIGSLRRGVHHNKYLQRSWNKYGEDTFEFGVLEYLENWDELVKAEQFWMDVYREEGKELYNYGLAADCPVRGHPHTEEAKRKMSKVQKGNQNALGCKRSKETRLKMSKSATARWARVREEADK